MSIPLACLLTVCIETPCMALLGRHRHWDDLLLYICVNIASNLLLNLSLVYLFPRRLWVILLLEVGVWGLEYAVYALSYGRSCRLLGLTVFSNVLSYTVGVLLQR